MFSSTNGTQNEPEHKLPDDWLIRPCEVYSEEYKDCRSFKARFHQYYVYGKSVDCSQWRRDSDLCYKWTNNNDLKAGAELIKSIKARRRERLKAHVENDVWENRTSPPKDWDKPLPDELLKEYETSFLNLKAKEMRGEPTDVIFGSYQGNFCSIS